jgi:hypothetical protein
MRRISLLVFILALTQPACIVAGGYGSGSGWYIWPGSFLSIIVILVLLFLITRRRR